MGFVSGNCVVGLSGCACDVDALAPLIAQRFRHSYETRLQVLRPAGSYRLLRGTCETPHVYIPSSLRWQRGRTGMFCIRRVILGAGGDHGDRY